MNDFTKEELQQIRGGLDWWLDNDWHSSHVLVQKIQSMIDNYCEHECNHENIDTNICYKCGWGIGR